MKRPYEEKLGIVLQVLDGEPIYRLSREYRLHETKILEWVRKYKKYGEEGLREHANFKATGKIKERLVRLVLEKGVPLAQIVVDYMVSRAAIENWTRKVRKNGYAALYKNGRLKRPPKEIMARPKKKEPQTELEKLQAENLRLRAENALLKKAKALVEEKRARALLNGPESSTN
mgnify:CR=1 FL=1